VQPGSLRSDDFVGDRDIGRQVRIGEVANADAMRVRVADNRRVQFDHADTRGYIVVLGIVDAVQFGVDFDFPGTTRTQQDFARIGGDIQFQCTGFQCAGNLEGLVKAPVRGLTSRCDDHNSDYDDRTHETRIEGAHKRNAAVRGQFIF